MVHTETTKTGYFSRIGKSLKGILFGIILLIGSIVLLWWNEGRTISTTQGLNQGQKITVNGSISPIDTKLEGKLIYINGEANTDDILNDTQFLVNQNAIKLNRIVEMYQWQEDKETSSKDELGGSETTTTTYYYKKTWDEQKNDSSSFKESGHDNPSSWPYESLELMSNNVSVGDLKLSTGFVHQINNQESVKIEQDKFDLFMVQNQENNPRLLANSIYIGEGDPSAPKIGDLRIKFTAVYPTEVTAIGKQLGTTLTSFTTKTDTKIRLLEYGLVSMEDMYKQAHKSNMFLAWVLRGVGLLLMYIGFNMIFGIIVTIAKILPILSKIVGVGTGLVSFVLTLILGGTTIIIARFFVRPLISIGVGIVVAAIIYMIYRMKRNKPVVQKEKK